MSVYKFRYFFLVMYIIMSIGSTVSAQTIASSDTLQFAGDSLNVSRRGAEEVVVRADGALFSIDTRKPVATIDFKQGGYYRIFATVFYSEDQINETFFIDVCNGADVFCVEPCDPNTGIKKVIVDDNGKAPEELTRDVGTFLIPQGVWTVKLNHFIDIANEFPDKWRCYPNNPDCKTASGIVVDTPESVHLRELTIIRLSDSPYDLAIKKRADKEIVFPGQEIQYSLTITNVGTSDAHNIRLMDIFPDSVDILPETVMPAFSTLNSDSLTWQFDVLAAGDSIDIHYRAKVAATFLTLPDTLINVSRVTALCDTLDGNNEATVSVNVIPRPKTYDLALKKSATKDTVFTGGAFSYTIDIVNNGRFDASDILVLDDIPSLLTVRTTDPVAMNTINSDTLRWQIPFLQVGDTTSIQVDVTVDENLELPASPFGQLNVSWLEAANDTNVTNNRDSVSVFLKEIFKPYDLQVKKNVRRKSVHPGDAVKYNLQIVNLGNNDAKNIDVWDDLPDSLNFVGANPEFAIQSGDTLHWQIAALAVGDTFQVDLTAKAPESLQPGAISLNQLNVVWISAAQDTNALNDRDSVSVAIVEKFEPYDLKLIKTVSQSTVFPGDDFTYDIDVVNLGVYDAFDVRVFDVLPDSLEFTSAQPATQFADTLAWERPFLSVGDTFHIHLSVKIPVNIIFDRSTFNQLNVGWVEADDDTNAINNRDSVAVVVRDFTKYDLALTKSASQDSVVQGADFSYTLNFFNLGPDTARSVQVWDLFPEEITAINVSLQPVTTLDADTVFWRITQLNPQDSLVININARVRTDISLSATPVTKTNQARVSGQFDTNPDNDFDSATVVCLPPPEFDCIVLDRNVFEPQRPRPGLSQDLGISFELKEPGFVAMDLYDISGYLITNLTAQNFSAGSHTVKWGGLAQDGQNVGSGVYIILFKYKNITCVEKVIIAR